MYSKNIILNELEKSNSPLTVLDLVKKVKVNKTTVYRSLEKLMNSGIVLEIDFGEDMKRYELSKNHHHHLVCLECKEVQDVDVSENFKLPKNFEVIRHNLEFFGYCHKCK